MKSMTEYYPNSNFYHIPWRNPATDSLTLTYKKSKVETFGVRFVRMDGEHLSKTDRERAAEIMNAVNTIKKRWLSDHWFWRFCTQYKREDDEDCTDEVFLHCMPRDTTLLSINVWQGDKYGHRLSDNSDMLLYLFSGLKKSDHGVLASFFQFWFDPRNRTSMTLVFVHQAEDE
jgi:hypothetical protein